MVISEADADDSSLWKCDIISFNVYEVSSLAQHQCTTVTTRQLGVNGA